MALQANVTNEEAAAGAVRFPASGITSLPGVPGGGSYYAMCSNVDADASQNADVIASINFLSLAYWLGRGNGTFGPCVTFGLSVSGIGDMIQVQDLNFDGRPDVLYAARPPGNHIGVFWGLNPPGQLLSSANTVLRSMTFATSVRVYDLNKSNPWFDIVATSFTIAGGGGLWILRGTGAGVFSATNEFSASQQSNDALGSDVDGDNDTDILVDYTYSGAGRMTTVYLNNGVGVFTLMANLFTNVVDGACTFSEHVICMAVGCFRSSDAVRAVYASVPSSLTAVCASVLSYTSHLI